MNKAVLACGCDCDYWGLGMWLLVVMLLLMLLLTSMGLFHILIPDPPVNFLDAETPPLDSICS